MAECSGGIECCATSYAPVISGSKAAAETGLISTPTATGSCAKLESIVTCSLCYEIFTAPKTFACFHSYCEKCIERLKPDPGEAKLGYRCPLCRRFCAVEDIQPNFLMNELVELFRLTLESGSVRSCTQCQASQPQWRCLDCKIDFCALCKEGHTRVPLLRGHRLIANEDINDAFLVDKLIFCRIHNDKLIEFNCKVCDRLLCITCKVVDHDCHKTETISTALERIVPTIHDDIRSVTTSIEEAEAQIAKLVVNKEEVQSHFAQIKDYMCKQKDTLVARILADYNALLGKLEIEERKVMTSNETRIAEIQDKIKEKQHVVTWANTSLQAAQGASLLLEIQSGLGKRLNNMAAEKIPLNDKTDHPENNITFSKREYPLPSSTNIIGDLNIVESQENVVFVQQQLVENNPERTVPFSLTTLKEKHAVLEQKIQILDGHLCYRFAIINSQLWLPIYNKNCILVYSTEGEHCETFRYGKQIKRPKALTTVNNENAVVCSQTGLHMIRTENGEIVQEIQNGNFSDATMVEKMLIALEWKFGGIHLYTANNNMLEPIRKIPLSNNDRHIGDTFICLSNCPHNDSCENDEDIFVACAWQKHVLFEYTNTGDVTAQYGGPGDKEAGQLYCPSLCASDRSGNLLIADCGNHRLQVKHKVSNSSEAHWDIVRFDGLHCPWDVHFYKDNMWVLNNERFLIKYCLT